MQSTVDDKASAAELSSKLWLQAKLNLSEDDRILVDGFASKNDPKLVNDLLDLTRKKQQEPFDRRWKYDCKDGSSIVFRDYFDKIVGYISKFQRAADFLVSMDVSGHAAAPWAAVKFFVSLITLNNEKWSSVLGGMEFITREISYYGIFEVIYLHKQFHATEQLSGTLVQCYTKILRYLAGAKRYYDQHSYQRFLKTVFSLDEDLQGIVTDIKGQREDVERLRGMIDGQRQTEIGDDARAIRSEQTTNHVELVGLLSDLTRPLIGIEEQLSSVHNELEALRTDIKTANTESPLPKIYNHLNPGAVTDYDSKLDDLTPGTAKWIFDTPEFHRWEDGDTPILFVSGGPGTGKSHLSTSIINYLLHKTISQQARSVGYYYFHDKNKEKESILDALCAAICQVARSNEHYCKRAADTCDTSPSRGSTQVRTVWNDFIMAYYAKESESMSLLFLVLDGIDEADQTDLADFLKIISSSDLFNFNIQILLVGRPEMEYLIKNQPKEIPHVKLEVAGDKTLSDIRKFSQACYDRCMPWSSKYPALRQKVITKLTKRANGVFLWIDLVFKEVLRGIKTPKQLDLALNNLPDGGLDDVYRQIFYRLESSSSHITRSILRTVFCWLTCSEQPLSLSYLNQLVTVSIPSNFSDVEDTLSQNCSSLLVLVKTGSTLFEELDRSGDDISKRDKDDDDLVDVKQEDHPSSPAEVVNSKETDDDYSDNEYDDLVDEELKQSEEAKAIHEEDQKAAERQEEIFVHQRHASLGDYLLKSDKASTLILLNAREALVETVVTALKIVCLEVDTDANLWVHMMSTLLERLESLIKEDISEKDLETIVSYIHTVFTSPRVAKYLPEHFWLSGHYPFDGDSIYFGTNSDLQHSNRVIVLEWLALAQKEGLAQFKPETSSWITDILGHPSHLLKPWTLACIEQWVKGTGPENGNPYNLAWLFLVSTDLIPDLSLTCDRHTLIEILKDSSRMYQLQIADADPYNFLANVTDLPKTEDVHIIIAQTAKADGRYDVTKAALQAALAVARQSGSIDKLKKVFQAQIQAFVDRYSRSSKEGAKDALKEYLALDTPRTAEILSYKGVVDYSEGDLDEAIRAFEQALEYVPDDGLTSCNLLLTLFETGDYNRLMKHVEKYGASLALRLREGIGHKPGYLLRVVMHAARSTEKLNIVIDSLGHGVEKIAASRDMRSWDAAYTSLERVSLGWLCYEYGGQLDKAMNYLESSILHYSGFFKLNFGSYTEMIMYFFGLCCQLVADQALLSTPESINEGAVLLESIRKRERICWEIGNTDENDVQVTNFPLARLYLAYGWQDQARKLLHDQFCRAVEVLQDWTPGNDQFAYASLAKLLFLNGQNQDAEIAIAMKQYCTLQRTSREPVSFPPQSKTLKEDEIMKTGTIDQSHRSSMLSSHSTWINEPDEYEAEAGRTCTSWHACEDGFLLDFTRTIYSCATCYGIQFCAKCHAKFVSNRDRDQSGILVCNPEHEFIKFPMEGLERIDEEKIVINGNEISLTGWLTAVRKQWKQGRCFR